MIKIDYEVKEVYSVFGYKMSITTDRKTVGGFINEWLRTYPHSGGSFTVLTQGNPTCIFKCGEIIGEPLPDEVLSRKLTREVKGSVYRRDDFKSGHIIAQQYIFEMEVD